MLIITMVSCEKVIDVELKTSEPQLVIEASINWEKGTNGSQQTILISKTTGYFEDDVAKVSGANVLIKNSKNESFEFFEEASNSGETGKYICQNFVPELGENYTLLVTVEGETYTSSEKLIATATISNIEQRNDLGFNSDEIGIKVNFMDLPTEKSFYMMRFDTAVDAYPIYEILDDKYKESNIISGLYTNEDLKTDELINISLFGVTERYYNYMKRLLGASSAASNGPFQVAPTKVKGNIVNSTNPENFAYGYFRLSETYKMTYSVK